MKSTLIRQLLRSCLIRGTRACKSCWLRLRTGKYRSLIIVVVLFSALLTLHFVRATLEFHSQMDPGKMKEVVINKDRLMKDGYPDVIDETSDMSSTESPASSSETWRDSTSQASQQIQEIQEIKGPGVFGAGNDVNKDTWSTTTVSEFGSSTEAHFGDNKDNAIVQGSKTFEIGTRPLQTGQSINNQLKQIREQMDGASTENPSDRTDSPTGSTAGYQVMINKDQVNNAGKGQFPLEDYTSSTSNPRDMTDGTTTDSIIGNTGPLTNIHDNILKIENEQQYIVNPAPGKRDSSVFNEAIKSTTEQYDDISTKDSRFDSSTTHEALTDLERADRQQLLIPDNLPDQKQANTGPLQFDLNQPLSETGQPQQGESQNYNLVENQPNWIEQPVGSLPDHSDHSDQAAENQPIASSDSQTRQYVMAPMAGSPLGQSGGTKLLFNQGNNEQNIPPPANGINANNFGQSNPSQQQANGAGQQQVNPVAYQGGNPVVAQQGNLAAASQQQEQTNNVMAQQGYPVEYQQQENPVLSQQGYPVASQQQVNPIPAQQVYPVSSQQLSNAAAQQGNPAVAQQGFPASGQQQGNLAAAQQQADLVLAQLPANLAAAQQGNSLMLQQPANQAMLRQGVASYTQQLGNVPQQGIPLTQQQAFPNTQQLSNSGLQSNGGQQLNQPLQPIVNSYGLSQGSSNVQQQINPNAQQQQQNIGLQQQQVDSASLQSADRPLQQQQHQQQPQQFNPEVQQQQQQYPPEPYVETAAPQRQQSNSDMGMDLTSGLEALKQHLSSGMGVANGVLNHPSNNENTKR